MWIICSTTNRSNHISIWLSRYWSQSSTKYYSLE